MKYRKKPVVIEAVHFTRDLAPHDLHAFLGSFEGVTLGCEEVGGKPDHILIETLEGTMRADEGDWVIRGTKGELYPCKPQIFEETYEPAHTETPRTDRCKGCGHPPHAPGRCPRTVGREMYQEACHCGETPRTEPADCGCKFPDVYGCARYGGGSSCNCACHKTEPAASPTDATRCSCGFGAGQGERFPDCPIHGSAASPTDAEQPNG